LLFPFMQTIFINYLHISLLVLRTTGTIESAKAARAPMG